MFDGSGPLEATDIAVMPRPARYPRLSDHAPTLAQSHGLAPDPASRGPIGRYESLIGIGIAAAGELGIDPRPVLMSLSVAAAAALLTPVATPVNLIAMGAAGYKFGDYWRLGLATMAVFFAVAVFLVPVFWPF